MTVATLIAVSISVVFAVTFAACVVALDDARTQRDEWRRNYADECRRHDATLARLEERESLAAANIVQLTYALQDATAQAQTGRGDTAVIGADVRSRFSRN